MVIDYNTLSKVVTKPFLCETDGKVFLVDAESEMEIASEMDGYTVSKIDHAGGNTKMFLQKKVSRMPCYDANETWVKEQFPSGDVSFF